MGVKRNIATILTVAAMAAMTACSPRGASLNSTRKSGIPIKKALANMPGKHLGYDDSRRYNTFFLEAIRQQHSGNFAAALDLLTHCLEIDSTAAEAYYRKALLLSEMDHDSTALVYLKKAATLAPDNDTYQERVAQFYIGTWDFDSAIAAYENIYSRHRDRSDVLEILLKLYQNNSDYDNMIATVERVEQLEGPSEETTLSKVRIYEMKGDKRSAYNALKKLTDDHPYDINYRVMMGNWLLQKNRKAEALKVFTSAVKEEPDNSYALESLYDYYKKEEQDSLANDVRDRILSNPHSDLNAKASMLKVALRENILGMSDSTEVIALFDKAIKATPNDAALIEMKATYMGLADFPKDSVEKVWLQVLDIAPDSPSARQQLIQSYWGDQRWDDIIAQSEAAVQYNPDEMVFYYHLGIANYQKKDNEAALNAFMRGVSQINSSSNPEIVSDFYAIMGDILHQSGKTEAAFAAYDSCLQWKDDNISCLNNYAYYLSEVGKDLQRAEAMSYKTIKEEPGNSTYLDTYAWILFKQGRVDEALPFIDQAVEADSDSVRSAVVLEHAGDIHAVNGDINGALPLWEEALKLADENINVALLQRKIRLKKYLKK